ncbi:MAG TPA: response regulator, partial [Acidimicrobiales bacterium]
MTDTPPLLVVDDTPENLVAVVAALEPLGRRIVTASSGEEALRQLLVEDFSLVVLDVQMPGIDGFETARAIKGRERTRDIPILFLTAISREDEHRLAGYETGAVDYLFKPISPELLRAKATVFVQLDAQRRMLLDQRAELERKTDALEQSNRDLEQFSYIASHDLQEPLRVVSGYLEMVLDNGAALGDDTRDWITRASVATRNMSDLVRDLLSYARAGLSTAPSETVDVRAALDTAIENLSLAISDAGATIVVAPDLPQVVANHRELVQVLQNLVGNALRHRAEHPP